MPKDIQSLLCREREISTEVYIYVMYKRLARVSCSLPFFKDYCFHIIHVNCLIQIMCCTGDILKVLKVGRSGGMETEEEEDARSGGEGGTVYCFELGSRDELRGKTGSIIRDC